MKFLRRSAAWTLTSFSWGPLGRKPIFLMTNVSLRQMVEVRDDGNGGVGARNGEADGRATLNVEVVPGWGDAFRAVRQGGAAMEGACGSRTVAVSQRLLSVRRSYGVSGPYKALGGG